MQHIQIICCILLNIKVNYIDRNGVLIHLLNLNTNKTSGVKNYENLYQLYVQLCCLVHKKLLHNHQVVQLLLLQVLMLQAELQEQAGAEASAAATVAGGLAGLGIAGIALVVAAIAVVAVAIEDDAAAAAIVIVNNHNYNKLNF